MKIENNPTFLLPDTIHGRSIFEKVIPTVNSLEAIFSSLEQKAWSIADLKYWEKPIIKAYRLEDIIDHLRPAGPDERISLVKNQILTHHASRLGSNPIAIYLLAYYLQKTNRNDLQGFIEFAKQQGITQKENSITAIWYAGKKDGKYLGILDLTLKIIDLNFLENWIQNVPAVIVKERPTKIRTTVLSTELTARDHLDCFLNSLETKPVFMGINSYSWCKDVIAPENHNRIPKAFNIKFYRDDVWDYCRNTANGDLESLLIILSWGGMNREHAKKLLEKENHVLDIVRKLRSGYFENRKKAFEYIQEKRKQGLLPGMGIGYFTKLICFLQPKLRGYIMDQWVAKSVNLLLGIPLVHIANHSWVSDENTPAIYEDFCAYIDEIAVSINRSGFETEEYLFSVGGHKKGKWRHHVVQHYI